MVHQASYEALAEDVAQYEWRLIVKVPWDERLGPGSIRQTPSDPQPGYITRSDMHLRLATAACIASNSAIFYQNSSDSDRARPSITDYKLAGGLSVFKQRWWLVDNESRIGSQTWDTLTQLKGTERETMLISRECERGVVTATNVNKVARAHEDRPGKLSWLRRQRCSSGNHDKWQRQFSGAIVAAIWTADEYFRGTNHHQS